MQRSGKIRELGYKSAAVQKMGEMACAGGGRMSNELKVHIYNRDQIDSQLAALARQLKQHETGTGFEVQVTRVVAVNSAVKK